METVQISEPKLSRFVFADTRFSWIWLLLRLFVGYEWLAAAWEKISSGMWIGPHAGSAIREFLYGAIAKSAGANPAVQGWYAYFINLVALSHPVFFSYLITFGECAVGLGLVLGAFTGIAAFFGVMMNFNYLFAGSVSINPLLILAELFLVLAWRNAGWLGLDRFLLPHLGTPWQKGKLFEGKKEFSPVELLLIVMGIGLLVIVGFALL